MHVQTQNRMCIYHSFLMDVHRRPLEKFARSLARRDPLSGLPSKDTIGRPLLPEERALY